MPNTTAADTVGMSDPGRKPATTAEDVLDVFDARDDRAEPLTAPELAEDLNCSRRTALNKLHDLEDDGRVSSKKVGGRSKVWWVPIHDTPADAVRRESGESTGDTPPTSSTGRDTAEDRDTDTDRLTAALDGLDTTDDLRATVRPALAGDGDLLERRVDAILRMYLYLREHGTAESDDLRDVVDPDAVDYADADSVWSNMVKGKDTLRALPGVRTPSTGKATWRYEDE